ncbi:hypothetical protein [Ruminococcus albus]|uniref:Uncharacterized protein n=1 Tax=Ruminococcus albus (strain ATCC 27210 / DSM 20455 / JCM 14654 / NCDO 2250 / 7) TaxID=697329 RepID=E6UH91_RUMA7|nr:hypothetical protein [Ruminococcus albus]ADU23169.1 hypothetical protein Rumal_2697 [Ruminococcus albus 7 = DSM 20455]
MKRIKSLLCITTAIIISTLSSVAVVPANAAELKSDKEAPTVVSATIRGYDGPSGNISVSPNGVKRMKTANSNGYAVSKIYDSCNVIENGYWGKRRTDVYGEVSSELILPSSGTSDGIPDWTMIVMCQLYVSNAKQKYTNSPTKSVYNRTYVSECTKTVQGKDFGTAKCTGYHTVKDYYGNIIWQNETSKSKWI